MKKVYFIHPQINTIEEMIEYLQIKDEKVIADIQWDSNNPDIVIASEHIYKNRDLLKKFNELYKNERRIFVYQAGEAAFPDLTIFDYAIAINTRLHDLDRIVRIPPQIFYRRSTIQNMTTNEMNIGTAMNLLNKKTKFCNFIYANPVAHPMRDNLFHSLSKYKMVDSLGGHLNNTGHKSTRRDKNWAILSVEEKQPYKFSIASENALFDGYTSEKILTSFQAHTVPIYWGNPYVAEEFNSAAFVNCHEFSNMEDLINRVREIDKNDELWAKMIAEPWQTDEQIEKSLKDMCEYQAFWGKLIENRFEDIIRRPQGSFANIYAQWFFRPMKKENLYLKSLIYHVKRKFRKVK